MKQEDNIIQASEGMMLTNGNVFAKKVALGKYDSCDNWWQITIEEYMAISQKEE